jgi:uncharacterized protein (TIGR01777 family)
MNIMVSGASGLVGSALKKSLEADGHTVTALPRTYQDPVDFSGVDAVVHLAGEPIASGRWTAEKKRRIEDSRVKGTRQLAEQLAHSANKPRVLVCASAIGFYGDRGGKSLDEDSHPGEGFLSEVCKKWEAAALPAQKAGIRTVWIRTGIVLDKAGGALAKMLPPFKMGGGGVLGSGGQYMSWISLVDEVGAIRFAIENETLNGPANLVAPNPVTNRDFTKTLGQVLRRPTILPLPGFAARILFGEMADALLLSSTRVFPKKLEEAGYTFRHAKLKDALEEVLR